MQCGSKCRRRYDSTDVVEKMAERPILAEMAIVAEIEAVRVRRKIAQKSGEIANLGAVRGNRAEMRGSFGCRAFSTRIGQQLSPQKTLPL